MAKLWFYFFFNLPINFISLFMLSHSQSPNVALAGSRLGVALTKVCPPSILNLSGNWVTLSRTIM